MFDLFDVEYERSRKERRRAHWVSEFPDSAPVDDELFAEFFPDFKEAPAPKPGGGPAPAPVAAYTLKNLAADVAAVARSLSDSPAILFGHDWGAPIAYHAALLHPDQFQAVAGLSVPYLPGNDTSSIDLWRALYPDRFFYQLYIQAEGVVEAEVSANISAA